MSSLDYYRKYGDPVKERNLVLFDVPASLEIGVIPKRIYCNKDLIKPLSEAFKNLIERGHVSELKTWDGCYNYRPIRGYEQRYKAARKSGDIELAMTLLSAHSWGMAIDVNAAWNRLNTKPTLSPGFVKCFTDAGFTWGGNFRRKDGMHFEVRV